MKVTISVPTGHGLRPGDQMVLIQRSSRLGRLARLLWRPRKVVVVSVSGGTITAEERRMSWPEFWRGVYCALLGDQ